jgi:tRNA nucleotidyltransferase (CCA-adding enzyme)
MDLKEILTDEDPVTSISNNIEYLVSIIPEIQYMFNFPQNHPHHHLDVWGHTLLALSYSKNDFSTRLALLLHDIGKPFSYQDADVRHFHGHPEVSAVMTTKILNRLGYSEEFNKKVIYLVRYHDEPITEQDIDNDLDLALERLHIQECDTLAHDPNHQEKRLKYVEETKKLIKSKENDRYF